MTNLHFYYSKNFDKHLSKWLGREINTEIENRNTSFTKELQAEWDKINNSVFQCYESFGFTLPSEWFGYVVTGWPEVVSSSHPLIIPKRRNRNMSSFLSILIHEIAHIEVDYEKNKILWYKIKEHLNKEFPGENDSVREHLFVNFLQEAVLKNVGIEGWMEELTEQKQWESTKAAWEILDKNKMKLNFKDPVESIFHLKSTHE